MVINSFEKLISDSVNIFSEENNIVGLILIGSLAKEKKDEYSDIDIVVVVRKGADVEIKKWEKYFMGQDQTLLSQIMNHGNWLSVLKKYDDRIVKVDYDFFDYDDLNEVLTDSFKRGTGICEGVILYEQNKLISKVYSENKSEKLNQNPNVNFNEILIHFFSAIRMYKRGELFETVDIIDQIRDPYLLSLFGAGKNLPFENYRRLESKFSDEILDRLRHTFCMPLAPEIKKALIEVSLLILDLIEDKVISVSSEQKKLYEEILSFIE